MNMIVVIQALLNLNFGFSLIFDIYEIENLNVGLSFIFHIRHSNFKYRT